MTKIIKPGQIVEVDTSYNEVKDRFGECFRLLSGEVEGEIEDAYIESIHVGARPYTIVGLSKEFYATCSENAVVNIYGRGCSHQGPVVYHEKRESWVCPFCLE